MRKASTGGISKGFRKAAKRVAGLSRVLRPSRSRIAGPVSAETSTPPAHDARATTAAVSSQRFPKTRNDDISKLDWSPDAAPIPTNQQCMRGADFTGENGSP